MGRKQRGGRSASGGGAKKKKSGGLLMGMRSGIQKAARPLGRTGDGGATSGGSARSGVRGKLWVFVVALLLIAVMFMFFRGFGGR